MVKNLNYTTIGKELGQTESQGVHSWSPALR